MVRTDDCYNLKSDDFLLSRDIPLLIVTTLRRDGQYPERRAAHVDIFQAP